MFASIFCPMKHLIFYMYHVYFSSINDNILQRRLFLFCEFIFLFKYQFSWIVHIHNFMEIRFGEHLFGSSNLNRNFTFFFRCCRSQNQKKQHCHSCLYILIIILFCLKDVWKIWVAFRSIHSVYYHLWLQLIITHIHNTTLYNTSKWCVQQCYVCRKDLWLRQLSNSVP